MPSVVSLKEEAIISKVDASMTTKLLIYHFVARAFGLRIAPPEFAQERHRSSISFLKTVTRRKQIYASPEFKQQSPRSMTVLEHVVEKSGGCWRLVDSPGSDRRISVSISCMDPVQCTDGENTSWVDFINSLTLVNVQQCTDGVLRRGIIAKR